LWMPVDPEAMELAKIQSFWNDKPAS